MGMPVYKIGIVSYSNGRELQLAFVKTYKMPIQSRQKTPYRSIPAIYFLTFFIIHFIRWEYLSHKFCTDSDKLSFYKAPPGHLIRTKIVQTWFLWDSPGMFFSVCAGKTCNYQKKLFILQRFAKQVYLI